MIAAEHEINTSNTRLIAQHPRPTGPRQKREIEKQVAEMLQDDVIRKSTKSLVSAGSPCDEEGRFDTLLR